MKWKRLLCMGVLLMLLAGCMENGGLQTLPSTDPCPDVTVPSIAATVPEATQLAEPEVTEPASTEPAATEPVLTAVNPLTIREVPAEATVLDHRTAAFLSTEQVADETEKTVTCVRILDLYTDEILAQKEFEGMLTGPVQDYCPGFLPLFDYTQGLCTVYDSSLNQLLQFRAPDRGGVFTEDLTTYYYVSAQRLFRMDTATGVSEQIVPDQALPLESIVDYDGETGRILVNVHTQYYLTKLCAGVIDLETGQFTLLSLDAEKAGFLKHGIAVTPLQEEENQGKLYLLDRAEAGPQLLQTVLINNMRTSSWHIPGSDYVISLHYYASAVRGAYNGCTLYRLTDCCESSNLGELLKLHDLHTVLALPDGNLLALLYSRQSTQPVLICTDQLIFSPVESFAEGEFPAVDTALAESYAQQSQEVEVAEKLLEVRAKADALEEKYAITILMSNQCQAPLENCSAQLVTTDQAGMKDEAKAIGSALKKLEAACELYPSDFFSQFRNEANERGVLILLVQDISAGAIAEGYDVLGISFRMDDWYPIAVDITTADMKATFCHELWHATEDKINEADPTLLSEVAWYRYNPRHFTYTNNGGGTWGADGKDTYLGGYGTESYFVDGYGKTSAYEDRARLMEYVMTSNYYSRKLMEAPALQRKLQAMADAIRKVFDTTDWKDVRWESNLS